MRMKTNLEQVDEPGDVVGVVCERRDDRVPDCFQSLNKTTTRKREQKKERKGPRISASFTRMRAGEAGEADAGAGQRCRAGTHRQMDDPPDASIVLIARKHAVHILPHGQVNNVHIHLGQVRVAVEAEREERVSSRAREERLERDTTRD